MTPRKLMIRTVTSSISRRRTRVYGSTSTGLPVRSSLAAPPNYGLKLTGRLGALARAEAGWYRDGAGPARPGRRPQLKPIR